MTKVLGIDPGKTTGWALIEVDENADRRTIKFHGVGETKDIELVDIADIISQADIVVYEEWLTNPKKALKGSFANDQMWAPRAIGSLRTICRLNKTDPKIVKQYNNQKPVGYALAGMKYLKGKKGMHQEDALAHAVFYAVRTLRAIPGHYDRS